MAVIENNPEMIELMTKELELNGVNFNKHEWLSTKTIIQESILALIPEIHEGKALSYGILFAEALTDLDHIEAIRFSADQIDLAKKFADGEEWFVLFEKSQFYGLARFKTPLFSEIQLIQSFPFSGGMIIQRDAVGVTKFFQGDSITLHDNRRWLTKPSVKEAAWKVSQCVANIDKTILNHILEFAFHLMSPATRAGGVLVWFLTQPPKGESPLASLKLSIQNETHARMLCHYLAQTDGATYLDRDGNLIETGVHLKSSEKSREWVAEFKGTRHTSSIRYSYDNEDAIVITISEDGPVTVFLNGANIADLQIYSAHKTARNLRNELPDRNTEVTSHSFEMKCDKCGKNAMIEQVKLEGFNVEKNLPCPTCKATLFSSHCFSLEGRPYKLLPRV